MYERFFHSRFFKLRILKTIKILILFKICDVGTHSYFDSSVVYSVSRDQCSNGTIFLFRVEEFWRKGKSDLRNRILEIGGTKSWRMLNTESAEY